MERPYILHMLTPGPQMSPFDVNMAADAGYQIITPYCGVGLDAVAGLTQDAIFSRGPKGVARTGLFIGGRDVILAADMLAQARKAMVPPFAVSVMADPSGSYTTAAALVAKTEAVLASGHNQALRGQVVLILGGTGTVGRIAGVLCAQQGAQVWLASHRGAASAQAAAQETGVRFGVSLHGCGSGAADLPAALATADVVLGCAAAGVQVLTAEQRALAPRLKVAADVNAVPPEGLAGVGVMDDGKPLPNSSGASSKSASASASAGGHASGPESPTAPVLGIGALAVGNVKYQTQHRLLLRMRESTKPLSLDFADAFTVAREFLAEKAAA